MPYITDEDSKKLVAIVAAKDAEIAALKEKVARKQDRERVAKIVFNQLHHGYAQYWDEARALERDPYLRCADALIAYMEGK